MAGFATNLEAMQSVVDRMASFERTLDERLEEVDRRAMRLHATWTGAAADEYAQVHRAWLRRAREMHAALGGMRRIVATAHGNYASAIAANRAMWP